MSNQFPLGESLTNCGEDPPMKCIRPCARIVIGRYYRLQDETGEPIGSLARSNGVRTLCSEPIENVSGLILLIINELTDT